MSKSTFTKSANHVQGTCKVVALTSESIDYTIEAQHEYIQTLDRSNTRKNKDMRVLNRLNNNLRNELNECKAENKRLQSQINLMAMNAPIIEDEAFSASTNNPTVQPINEYLLQLAGTGFVIYFIGFSYQYIF